MKKQGWGLWLTGLPASGKSTLAQHLREKLEAEEIMFQTLESDEIRRALTPNPTYTPEERDTFYRTMVYIGELLVSNGVNVVFDATANRRRWREEARKRIPRFMEVYLDCPLEVCMERDPKGIYKKAREGRATYVPGAQQEYERPLDPELILDCRRPPMELTDDLVREMRRREFI